MRNYGITIEQYDALVRTQGGLCAICKSSDPCGRSNSSWHVDHDHVTGTVRGLLCAKCNRAIGLMGDDADILQAAVYYLKRSR